MRPLSFSRKPGSGFLRQAVISTILCTSIGPIAFAKSAPLTAIVLYDGPTGASYVQVSDLLINGKPYVRDCTPFQGGPVDKSTYGKMQKLELAAGLTLERDKLGILRYGPANGNMSCVVPENAKFEHSASSSLWDLADQARLSGTAIDAGATVPPILQKGAKLVLLAAPDKELAEFLVAQRAGTISGWQNYLAKYTSSSHVQDAKASLSLLIEQTGEGYLAAYVKSAATPSPSYSDLKDAKAQAEKALSVTPAQDQAKKLIAAIAKELNSIADRGQSELQLYKTALQTGVAGYSHLLNAKRLGDAMAGIDPAFQPGQNLLANALQASNAFDAALRNAESAVAAKQMDAAMENIKPLIPFSSEEPRIPAVVDAAYNYYFQLGKQFSAAADWDNAIKNLNKAVKIKDTAEADEALKEANKQQVIARDKEAAAKALEASKGFEDQKEYIEAFEALYSLPPAQKALVSEDIDRLKDLYVKAATDEASKLQKIHEDLAGIADEREIEKAYGYYEMAFGLTQQAGYHDSMDVLAHDLSKYFVAQAKIYIEKPEGSGTEIGWHFLGEALAYEPSNPAAIDAQTAASAAHQMHSKVSLKVRFRDRTSSRNSSGFIDTLEDTIVAALEESPMVKAVRASEQSSGTTSVEPDFQLDGEILEHEITPTPTSIPKESHYRAGTEPYTNDKWTQAKHAFDAANRDIETDRTELQAAETKGKKKEIQEWKDKLAEHQKKATDAQAALDSTQQNLTRDVIRSYNYTQQTIDVKNTIKLQFRIGEKLGDEKGNAEVVEKEENKQFILIEDVKPEDTDNIKNAGTSPITRELQTALENLVRDKLVEKVKERVSKLPEGIYSQAKMKEQEENINGAAESYLRFLSVTTEDGSAERKHAQEFLEKNFNMDIDDEAKR